MYKIFSLKCIPFKSKLKKMVFNKDNIDIKKRYAEYYKLDAQYSNILIITVVKICKILLHS